MAKKPVVYYDTEKYQIADNAPNKWAQTVPGHGNKEFQKEYLTNEDMEALIAAGSKYVSRKS